MVVEPIIYRGELMQSPSRTSTSFSPASMLLALGFGAVLGCGFVLHDWLSAGVLLLVLLGCCRGYRRGGLKIAGTVLGLLVAVHFAEPCAELLAPYFQRWIRVGDEYQGVAQLAAAGCLLALGVFLVFRLLAQLVFATRPGWQRTDQWLGGVLGGVQGALLSLIVLFAIIMLEPVARQCLSAVAPSHPSVQLVAARVVAVNEQARQGLMQPVIEAMQPMQVRVYRRASDLAQRMESDQPSTGPHAIMLLRGWRGGK